MIRSLLLTVVLSLSSAACYAAFDLSDCIINGMKGVSSDMAARQVRYACDQKNNEFKRQRREGLAKEFGAVADTSQYELDPTPSAPEKGYWAMELTNKSSDKTIAFVRMEVAPTVTGGTGLLCDPDKTKSYPFKVTIKPGASLLLTFPVSTERNCAIAGLVTARPPSWKNLWKDLSFGTTMKPSDSDPFELD